MTTDETSTVRKETLERARDVTAATARDEVRGFLDERFCREQPATSEDVVLADALLVASELVTNAIRHGGGVRAFRLSLADEGLWITVTDRNRSWPTAPASGSGSPRPGGFGLRLIRRLSKEVTITPAPGGKSIHALVPLR
ncbi:ATP-binding protein [Streptomyces sp. NPDC003035]|uniref:ATP-binding protein n=1 Tax=Streptomyces sp. NPDC003035 TaxID=3364676 RepID=UPI00367773E3